MNGLRSLELYHPVVMACYICTVLVFTMMVIHPVFLLLSWLGAMFFYALLEKPIQALRTLVWQVPVVVVVTFLNGFLAQHGSTVLFKWGGHNGFFLESAVFGLLMGIMLVAVIIWFMSFTKVFRSDKLLQLTGNCLPTIGLMLTMVFRLVPQFVRRGKGVLAVQQAGTAAKPYAWEGAGMQMRGVLAKPAQEGRFLLRMTNVLMAWSMEDSLDTACSMKARGWGVAPKRSCYQRSSFRMRDALALAVLLLLVAASVITAMQVLEGFAFYPTISPVTADLRYGAFLLLLLFPCFLDIRRHLPW